MTNEQFAIYLQEHSNYLLSLVNELRTELPESMPRHEQSVWIGDGPEPQWGFRRFSGFGEEPANYEMRPVGDFVALDALKETCDRLSKQSRVLMESKEK